MFVRTHVKGFKGLKAGCFHRAGEPNRVKPIAAIRRMGTWLSACAFALFALLALPNLSSAQNLVDSLTIGSNVVGMAVNPSQNNIFVTTGDNKLTYFDGLTNTVQTINDPGAANTNGASAIVTYLNGVFVANSLSNDISTYYIFPGGYQFQGLIQNPNGIQPVAMVHDPSNFGILYVANKGSNNVSVFTLDSMGNWNVTATVGVGTQPTAIVKNLPSNLIYVANSGSNSVSVIDGSSNTVVATVTVGTNPQALALNPQTGKVYVANAGSDTITVINGSNNSTSTITGVTSGPAALTVNPLTNQIYALTYNTANVYIIDGSADAVTNSVQVSASSSSGEAVAIAVDPITNFVYASVHGGLAVVDGTSQTAVQTIGSPAQSSNGVLVLNPITHNVYYAFGSVVEIIDAAANLQSTVTPTPTQNAPHSVAVNPATNRIYVTNNTSNSVTVLDGTTNSVLDSVTTGTNPSAIALDLLQNLIYVTNSGDQTVTVINGPDDETITLNDGTVKADSIAVNPVLEQVYGASSTANFSFNFPSSFGNLGGGSGPTGNSTPIATLTNPASGMVYTLYKDGNLEIDDSSAPHSFIDGVCLNTGGPPTAMDVNTVTNTVFVTCASGEVDAIQGASGFFSGISNALNDPNAVSPVAVAVNSVTNKIYVANAGTGNNDGTVTEFDGVTGQPYTIYSGETPVGIAVNPASGKVYVQSRLNSSSTAGTITIIVDTGTRGHIEGTFNINNVGTLNSQLATDPINGTAYALNRDSNNVSTFQDFRPNGVSANGPVTTILPFTNNIYTTSATPTFSFTAASGVDGPSPYAVYYQVDSQQGYWNYAGSAQDGFSGTQPSALPPGFHVLYAFAVSGGETSPFISNNGTGSEYNPFVGPIASYGFLIAPPNAGTPYYPITYPTLNIGTTSPSQQPLLSNHGGVPLSFTYSISGPNAADFFEVPYTGTDTLCNTLNGSLPSRAFCDVNIAFRPSIDGLEQAVLTFTDNSLGVAGSTQTVLLQGTGQGSALTFNLSVNFTGNGAGSVSDGANLVCHSPTACSQAYSQGSVVNLTATPSAGSIFYGWSGACTGSGACSVTMSAAQTVTANFTSAVASNCAPGDILWIGGASGVWSNAANWSGGVVPNGTVHVCINGAQSPASQVTLDTSVSVGGLTINAGNTLTLGNGTNLAVSGTISNSGIITITSGNSNTYLRINGAVTLTGGGTLILNQPSGAVQPIIYNNSSGSLTNVNNVIQGGGLIGQNNLAFTNQSGGVVNATSSISPLQIAPSSATNQGLFEATTGTLQILSNVNNNSATITAAGSNANVQILNTTVQGGTLSSSAGGTIGTTSGFSATLDGSAQGALTIVGTFNSPNNTSTYISGTIINNGTMQITSGASLTYLRINGAVTLTGGGTVNFTQPAGAQQPILYNNASGSLTNVNNLIQGAGLIGQNNLAFTNQAAGIISANNALFPLEIVTSSFLNQGLLQATGSGSLQILSSIQNQGSTIKTATATASVSITNSATIQGGTLDNSSGGSFSTGAANSAFLDGSTLGQITLAGIYTGPNNTNTHLLGTINNTGTLQITSGANLTYLRINGAVTLTGGGTLNFTEPVGAVQPPILYNDSSGSFVNVNNLIQGAGILGQNGLAMTNRVAGVISATNSGFPFQIASGSFLNQGLLQATGSGALQILTTIQNQGATIRTTASTATVQITNSASIQGGTIDNSAGGTFGTGPVNTAFLDGSTLGQITLAGIYTALNNTNTYLIGTINNTGTIQITAGVNTTYLRINGPVTLTGGGTLILTQTSAGLQPILYNNTSGSLTNVNNLIEGAGLLGQNSLAFTNQVAGVVSATSSSFPLQIGAGTTVNLGVFQATGSGTLQILSTITNGSGKIVTTGSGASLQVINTTVQGGTLSNAAGGNLGTVSGSSITLDGSTAQGAITIGGTFNSPNNTNTYLVGTINNTGTIQITSGANLTYLRINGPVTLTGGGTLILTQPSGAMQPIIYNNSSGSLDNVNNLIEGAGLIGQNSLALTNGTAGTITANAANSLSLDAGSITNQGLIIANGSPTLGVLTVNNYTQTATGGFAVALGGLTAGTQYSQWHDTGTTTLAGALNILLTNGFVPAVGNQFTILTSGSITGQFSSINSPSLGIGKIWNATYTATSVVLSVVASTGGSGTLIIDDLGTGSGTVTDDLDLLNCTTTGGVISGTCSGNYASGSIVTLTATPVAGSTFNGWNTCTGTGTCAVTVTGQQAVSATFVPTGSSFPLNISLIGTGNGTVTDNLEQINCTNTAGIISGTCSASYPTGTVVNLTATPLLSSTFGGWLGACTGVQACSVTMNGPVSVTASLVPPPQMINLSFPVGSNVAEMATYVCPSNPNPTPQNPCLDPNAHAIALGVSQVTTPFTLTVQASEVPPTNGDGICPSTATPSSDFDCRFKSFFTYQINGNGAAIVPICYPYANGNCVHYTVYYQNPGTEPDPSWYVGPVNWTITYNNDTFVPPALYTGSTPRLYDDPDGFVLPNSPYGTNCSTPMQIGNPGTPTNPAIFCQYVFDITTFYDPNKKVDAGIGGKTRVYNDVVVAIPPANVGVLTLTTTPDAATVTAGAPIGFTITIANASTGIVTGATLNDLLPAGAGTWMVTGSNLCSITGAAASQVLGCSFGNISANTSISLHLQSTTSSVGTVINAATITSSTNQQQLTIGSVAVQAISVTFRSLTPSQSIPAGTASIALTGALGNGNQIFPAGETLSITINGITQAPKLLTNGNFSATFVTSAIPASGTPYPISYSYAGDSTYGPASDSSTSLTVIPAVVTYPLTVTLIGTGNGTVSDNSQRISCTDTAGVTSGTCTANYPAGTVVALNVTPVQPSTFGGWLGACTGVQACSVTMNGPVSVTASLVPPPQMINLSFPVGSNVAEMATYVCPSNPNPTPQNPCLDPNAHAIALGVSQVTTPFTLTVQASEVPPTNGDGICPSTATPSSDFDCRFKSFFTYQINGNGAAIVPICYPYANGNCVHYTVYYQNPGTEPDPSWYVGPVNWTITYNNDTFVPPALYTGSTPRLYDDPDGFVLPNSPYGTNCSTPMQIGNPGTPTNPAIFCQYVFDITTFYDPNKKVDAGIGGKTRVYNDVVVAIPPANVGVLTLTTTPDAAAVTAGAPIGFTITIANASTGIVTGATLNDLLPAGAGNWKISPTYAGPGSCSLTGATGSQVLACSFGNVAPTTTFSLHLLSATSTVGNIINAATITSSTKQQQLTIGSVAVQPVLVTFTALTSSQSISMGTTTITLAGVIGTGTAFPPVGESVSININGATQSAAIGANGKFSTTFPTATIPASTTPYVILYTYAGDTTFGPATNSATTLTVTPVVGSTLKISPMSIDFGQVPAGGVAVRPVTLSNTGKSPIAISSVSVTKNGNAWRINFFAQSFCPRSLQPEKNCTVFVAYVPDFRDTGAQNAALTITDSAAGSPQSVPLTGTSINPIAIASSYGVSFGTQKVGTTSTAKTVTITNVGTTPLVLGSSTIEGDFNIGTGTTCTSGVSLAPGKTCAYSITFTPKSRGIRGGLLKFTNNGLFSEQFILLAGFGN
jgi:YVTN family beta-propeller protein